MARAEHVAATRDDVAARAGVSTATVSRVYNAPESVSPAKVERVHAAAAKLGYVPDKNASALRRSGTGSIVMLEQRGGSVWGRDRIYTWFYTDVLRGLRSVLDESMYQLRIQSYSSPAELARTQRAELGDGVILHESGGDALVRAVRALGLPYVRCGQTEPPAGVNSCHTDNVLGGREAARVLRDAGHARPAHITGSMAAVPVCGLRLEGFRSGWHGTDVRLIDGQLGIDGGYDSGTKIVPAVRKRQVDCIFVVNDLTAVGVLQALLDAKVRVPDEVSVIGYDNLPFVEVLPLRLASIDISFGTVYATAARRLLESIRTGEPVRERVSPAYVEGETVRARP